MQTDRLLTIKDVIEITQIGRSTIFERMAKGTFPKSYAVSARKAAWKSSDVQKFIDELPLSNNAEATS